MRLDDKEIMLLWEQGVLRSSRSTPTKQEIKKDRSYDWSFFLPLTFHQIVKTSLFCENGNARKHSKYYF